MNRLPLSEFMMIVRDVSKHQGLTKMSNNWSTVAALFSCTSAWAVYFYLNNYHSTVEDEIAELKKKRDIISQQRKKRMQLGQQSEQQAELLKETQKELKSTLASKDRWERLLWTGVGLGFVGIGGYLTGRYHGYKRFMRNTERKLKFQQQMNNNAS